MLNRVYKELYVNLRESAVDFNMMVDSIIQISPAYSSEREKKDPKDAGKEHKEIKDKDGIKKTMAITSKTLIYFRKIT